MLLSSLVSRITDMWDTAPEKYSQPTYAWKAELAAILSLESARLGCGFSLKTDDWVTRIIKWQRSNNKVAVCCCGPAMRERMGRTHKWLVFPFNTGYITG